MWRERFRRRLPVLVAVGIAHLFLGYGRASAAAPGDCNGDDAVTVNELILGVSIALGQQPLAACSSFDANRDGNVAINELVIGVNNALNGITVSTATATASADPTATSERPSPIATITPNATATDSPAPTASATAPASPTASASATSTHIPVPTPVDTETVSPTATRSPTGTPTITRTPTQTRTGTPTAVTATRTFTNTAIATPTRTGTGTPTATFTLLVTPTVTPPPIYRLGAAGGQIGDHTALCFALLDTANVASLSIDLCVSDTTFNVGEVECSANVAQFSCNTNLDPSAVVLGPTEHFPTCELDAVVDAHGLVRVTLRAKEGHPIPSDTAIACSIPVALSALPGDYPLDVRVESMTGAGQSSVSFASQTLTVFPAGPGGPCQVDQQCDFPVCRGGFCCACACSGTCDNFGECSSTPCL